MVKNTMVTNPYIIYVGNFINWDENILTLFSWSNYIDKIIKNDIQQLTEL